MECDSPFENESHSRSVMSKEEPGDKNKDLILDCVARSDGFFKSQQRGEKDLDFEEKRKIAEEILNKNVPLFLKRYGKFLHIDTLSYFEPYKDDYEVNFYLMEVERILKKNGRCIQVKNRRYEALQRLIKEGSYFSDCEMKERNPLLFEQMIGQFMTEKEITDLHSKAEEMKFSTLLMTQMEKNRINLKQQQQQDEEDCAWEEGDSSESEMEDDPPALNSDEKQLFRNEFLSVMYEQFLSGKDKDFDYSSVDGNTDYDELQIRGRDEEERYFDAEEPDWIENL